ncbi:protein MpMAPKKK15 [Marchantia polymorpha subsp. ruderalis]
MGLMSRAAVEPDAMGNKATDSRWLFPLRRFEEELLEHILMSASCSNPWPGRRGGKEAESGTQGFPVAKERSNVTDVVQRKIEKIGKNVVGKVKVLKQVFTESLDKGSEKEAGRASREECRKVACNEIVRATLHRHPGSQLPDVFVCTLQAHFDSFPNSYARAGFNSEQVFMHIRLLDQAKLQPANMPVLHLQAADCMSRSSNVSEFSSTTSSPSSSVWDDNDRSLMDEVIDVAFACNSSVSKPALVWAFEHEMITVKQATVFERKGSSLGVIQIQCPREKSQQDFIRQVIRTAIRKSRFSKFSFGLCGCEVPSFSDQRGVDVRSTCSSKDQASVSSAEEGSEFKENYWNEADFNFTSTSFVNSGYGVYGSYGYPCYRGPSSPGGLFRILAAEGTSPEIISGEGELGRWLVDGAELLIEEEVICTGSSGTTYHGHFKGEEVAVKEVKGCKGGLIIEGDLRRDVLSLSSCDHKNLVPFYGISLDTRHSSYIATVCKYMEGGSLFSLVQKGGGLQLSDLLRIARDVAEGLRFLHDQGVVHRDLKSTSVLFDGSGAARVGDLGVVRLWNAFTEDIPVGSNFYWMAPEALGIDSESNTVTGKSDVYSYGMLLWEMLTGQQPYASYSPVQAALGVAVHGMRPTIPDTTFLPLKCLIEQCWASDPLDRPDFSEVLEVLDMATQELLSRDKS